MLIIAKYIDFSLKDVKARLKNFSAFLVHGSVHGSSSYILLRAGRDVLLSKSSALPSLLIGELTIVPGISAVTGSTRDLLSLQQNLMQQKIPRISPTAMAISQVTKNVMRVADVTALASSSLASEMSV